MREIKFRAWDRDNEIFVYAEPIYGFFPSLGMEQESVEGFMDAFMPIQQYTGLKDYSKKDIYEGDIIKFTEIDEDSCLGREETNIVVVKWIDEIAQWRGVYSSGQRRELHFITNFAPISECEVIGNIYENPELLDKQ